MANSKIAAVQFPADCILFPQRRLFEACYKLNRLVRSLVVVLRANFELSIKGGKGFVRNPAEDGQVDAAVQRRAPEAARAMVKILTPKAEGTKLMRRNVVEAQCPAAPPPSGRAKQ